MSTKVFQKRIDEDLLSRVSEIYESLGTTVGDAFVMFLKKSEETRGLPFELRQTDSIGITNFQKLALLKSNAVRLDMSKKEDVDNFFDEDFSEYEDLVSDIK